MDIKKIKQKANQMVLENKQEIIRIMSIIVVINLIPSFFESFDNTAMSALAGVASILCATFYHGYVVSGLKIARHNANEMTDDDAYVGIKRFKELFPTYIIKNLISAGIVVICAIVLMIICMVAAVVFVGGDIVDLLLYPSSYYDFSSLGSGLVIVALLVLVAVAIVVIVAIFVNAYLFATPYLLERYHMKNMEAIKESYSFMKGHVKDYILLELSYLGWMILIVVIDALCSELLSFIPVLGSVIGSLVSGIIAVYLYTPQYYTSLAIFFEEIAYRRYNENVQSQDNSSTVQDDSIESNLSIDQNHSIEQGENDNVDEN